jgi:mannose/fructose/N-acetylgalactosamine-specific phosphotransferase system component IIB
VENTVDARILCEHVDAISHVVFGGIRHSGNKKLIDRQVYLSEEDINNWKAMVALGKDVIIQVIPSEKVVSLTEAERIFNR